MPELRSIARQMPIEFRDKCRCSRSERERDPARAAPVVGQFPPLGIRPPSRSMEPPVISRHPKSASIAQQQKAEVRDDAYRRVSLD